jgi:tellurite methyltransferase
VSDASPEPPGPRERWNRRYAARGVRAFPEAPSEWLAENRSALSGPSGRRALDIACGDGRNAAYLARLGFEVDAVDISDVAIDALQAATLDRGLEINPLRIDLEREPLPGSDYNVIVQLNYLQRSLFEPLAKAITPGGILILETVTLAHAEELGNRFDPRFMLEPDELLESFPDLDVLRYEEHVAERSGRPRALASLVARRRRSSPRMPTTAGQRARRVLTS